MDNVWLHRIILLFGVGLAWYVWEHFGATLKRKMAAGNVAG